MQQLIVTWTYVKISWRVLIAVGLVFIWQIKHYINKTGRDDYGDGYANMDMYVSCWLLKPEMVSWDLTNSRSLFHSNLYVNKNYYRYDKVNEMEYNS